MTRTILARDDDTRAADYEPSRRMTRLEVSRLSNKLRRRHAKTRRQSAASSRIHANQSRARSHRHPAPRRVSGSRRVSTTTSPEPTCAPPPEDAPSRRGTLALRSAS